ncbi:MAG: biopolymer transporter ExbD [Planctomycetota bacterium]
MSGTTTLRRLPRREATGSPHALAPLVDVVLLLLIFILVSARFDRSEVIEVTLPRVAGGGAVLAEGLDEAALVVFKDGSVSWRGRALSLAELELALAAEPPEARLVPLVVRGDTDVRLGDWMPVLSLLGRLGFTAADVGVEAAPERE